MCLTPYESVFETCDDYGEQPDFLVELTLALFLIEFITLFICFSSLSSMKFASVTWCFVCVCVCLNLCGLKKKFSPSI